MNNKTEQRTSIKLCFKSAYVILAEVSQIILQNCTKSLQQTINGDVCLVRSTTEKTYKIVQIRENNSLKAVIETNSDHWIKSQNNFTHLLYCGNFFIRKMPVFCTSV